MDPIWDHTVSCLERAPLDPQAWGEALEGVTRLSGARVGNLVALGGPGWLQANWLWGVPPDAPAALIEAGVVCLERNPRVRAGSVAPLMRLMDDTELLRGRRRTDFPLYRELDRVDSGFATQVILHRQDDLVVGLAVGSEARRQDSRLHDRGRFARLAALAAQAVRLQLTLEERGAAVLARNLEAVPLAAFVCAKDGRILQATAAGEQLLRWSDRLRMRGGRLEAVCAEDDRRLAAAFAHAGYSDDIARSLLVRDAEGACPLMLDLARLPTSPYGLGLEPAVLVIVRDGAEAARRGALAAGEAFGFTAAEITVAEALVAGRSPEEIAASRGVSVNTVRSQLRGLYEKAGVTRQAELVAMILGCRRAD